MGYFIEIHSFIKRKRYGRDTRGTFSIKTDIVEEWYVINWDDSVEQNL